MIDTSTWYLNQPWYVRLWRNRHVVRIPVDAAHWYWTEQTRRLRHETDWRLSLGQCWSMARGYFDARRQKLVQVDETFDRYVDDD
jgi:hypothetical protein